MSKMVLNLDYLLWMMMKEISSVQAKLSPKGVLNIMSLKLHTIGKAQGQRSDQRHNKKVTQNSADV